MAVTLIVLLPNRAPQLVGPATSTRRRLDSGNFSYRLRGPVLAAGAARASATSCGSASAVASVRSLSLLGGRVRIGQAAASIAPPTPGSSSVASSSIVGLRVRAPGRTLSGGTQLQLGHWGMLRRDDRYAGRVVGSPRSWDAAVAITLTRAVGGLPAGSRLLVGVVGSTAPLDVTGAALPRPGRIAPPRTAAQRGAPLSVTPSLDAPPYVFPVAGPVAFGDTYGAARSDVPGGWHHGDDIFAELGAPVLAVADGTVFSVGWNPIGGWRLWLRDRQGNQFYYAHLSGYTALAKNGQKVRAGDPLAFVGNTGDAITTPHHLHFEVHPVSLLGLGYNGAVDPTTYLDGWRHVAHAPLLAPVALPSSPVGLGDGALSDYQQLLLVHPAARAASVAHPVHATEEIPPDALTGEPRPGRVAAAADTGRSSGSSLPLAALAGVLAVAVLVAARRWLRRREAEL